MHSQIILKSFDKIREVIFGKTGVPASDTTCAKELSVIISESFPYGERSLRNLYNSAKIEEEVEVRHPQVILALCKYLGYDSYEDYLLQAREELPVIEKTESIKKQGSFLISSREFIRKNKITLGIVSVATIVLIISLNINRQRWMIWENDHYVEAKFDSRKVQEGSLKIFKQDRIDDFQQVIADCKTQFFAEDGSVKLWYGKNTAGDLEYFTSYGLHPITGKTLRPITRYMIRTHICE